MFHFEAQPDPEAPDRVLVEIGTYRISMLFTAFCEMVRVFTLFRDARLFPPPDEEA